ncbi:MAG TPA: BTAD domain-containing putative transcriptional regulator [Gaiellaceae bacterium]|nr:BTAD domain-containing putative transcriptional regulator [Gaiellaceae bacterium]
MQFSILGPLEAVDDTGPVELAGGKPKALLALLLLQAGRAVPVDRIVDGLWGEDVPESAPKMVQIFVSQLRKQLPRGLIQTRSPGYRVDLEGHSLDLHTFEALHAGGRVALADGRAGEAVDDLRRALSLWHGTALAEFAEPFARPEEARLAELQLTCLEEGIDAELALGRHPELVAELDALVRSHPLRERLRSQLMLALYRSGRHAEALDAFQSFRRTLQDELGIDPPPRAKELERLVLQQDPSLDLAPAAAAPEQPAPTAPAPPPPARAESRKLVTVLVADVAPAEMPGDPEALRAALSERADDVRRELDHHGASVASLDGGRLVGVFGVPTAHDDDSLRAVTAAVALREAGLAARAGLSTGEVVTGDPLVSGAPVEEAARLQERAGAGEVLAAARTWHGVRHAVSASNRDGAWSIAAVDAAAAPLRRRLETPLVGRERELHEITDAFERAVAARTPQLVTVFGTPGVGKTRLALECVERLRGLATPAVAHCRAGAREAAYSPLRDVLTELAGGDTAAWIERRLRTDDGPELAGQLAAATGLAAGAAHAEDAALAARRLLGGLARERPLLLVLEDVHWAAPPFLDLVESLVELAHAPLLVLCLARPDLLDVRPHWGGGRLSSSTVLLDALPAAASETLLGLLEPRRRVDAGARSRILAVADGNPLFIEQLLAAALEGDADAIPDSIQMLLAARLDRLDEADRACLQAAAVCGPSFTTADVSALVGGDTSTSLVALVRRELLRPGEADDPTRSGWSFRHALVREVAYAGMPKWRRAELHERLAERALEQGTDGDVAAAHHLDLALRARREAGERGPAVDGLAERAAEHLRRAGLAASDRDDWTATVSLLGRAGELLPRASAERVELLPKLGEALVWSGDYETGRARLAEAQAIATEIGDGRLVARARLAAALALMWTEQPVPPDRMLREIDEAVPVLERAGDREALAMAELARFHAFDRSRLPSPEERLTVAREHARAAGARAIEHRVASWICITLPGGSVPVEEALERVDEILATSSSAYVRASARGARGLLLATRGEFEQARELVEETRQALEELGLWLSAAGHSIAVAEVELLAGNDPAAEAALRGGLETLSSSTFDELSTANVAWRLALLLARQGREEEAERLARIAAGTRAPGLWVETWWRIVLALVEARRGATARALELVAEARDAIASTHGHGSRMETDALVECATVLAHCGQTSEPVALLDDAIRIADRLGYRVALRRAEEARRTLTT